MKANTFSIIANVAFAIPAFLSGAFNSHHKARLVKVGSIGTVTPEGVKHFGNRARVDGKAVAEELKAAGYRLVDVAGIQWPFNAQNAAYPMAAGKVSLTLFAEALSDLTQAAHAKAKAEEAAKAKAEEKAATKPATKPASKAKAKAQVKAGN